MLENDKACSICGGSRGITNTITLNPGFQWLKDIFFMNFTYIHTYIINVYTVVLHHISGVPKQAYCLFDNSKETIFTDKFGFTIFELLMLLIKFWYMQSKIGCKL